MTTSRSRKEGTMAWEGDPSGDPVTGDSEANDHAQFLAIADDMRDEIVQASKAILKAVSGLVGKEHIEALETCSRDLAQAVATMERLEARPQLDVAGRLDDVLALLQRPATKTRPWWLMSAAITSLLLLGTCIGWASKWHLAGPVPVIQAPACPSVPVPGKKVGK